MKLKQANVWEQGDEEEGERLTKTYTQEIFSIYCIDAPQKSHTVNFFGYKNEIVQLIKYMEKNIQFPSAGSRLRLI